MKNQKKPALVLSLLVLTFLNLQGISKPMTTETHRCHETLANRYSNVLVNTLTVYYSGYTVDNTLYVRNKNTKQVQAQVMNEDGAFIFELRSQGGEYEIMANTCPPKADCWDPYKILKTIKLGAGEDKTISL